MRRILLVAVAATALPAALRAQAAPDSANPSPGGWRPFVVTPFVGMRLNDTHSALRRSVPVAGLDLTYRFNRYAGLGITLGAGRPKTDGDFFPLVRMQAGDTSDYFRVSQRLTEYTYGVQGLAMLPAARIVPYASAGVGRYTFIMDPQAVSANRRYSGPMFSVGGGLNIPMGTRTGVTLDARDVILASYDRERLDATDPLFRDDTRFDPVAAGKPQPRSTIHNLRFSIGVSFIPDARGGGQ